VVGDERAKLEAVVIETDKSRAGLLVSLVVRKGVLKVKDEVLVDKVSAKVRGLIDFQGRRVKEVGPGEPVQVLGFSDLPSVGSQVWKRKGEGVRHSVSEEKPVKKRIQRGELSIVLKAKSSGALEAVVTNIPEKVVVVDSGVGDVNESDIFMAKSANTSVFAFESKVSRQVKKLAQAEGVDVKTFEVIYELFEELEKLLREDKVIGLGKAEVIESFPFNKKRVAGCRVAEGRISKNDKALLVRGEEEIGKIRLVSMKKGKLDVNVVKPGEECGILFAPQLEFEIGDMIISVRK
jgi:translation initiation factor IF-2